MPLILDLAGVIPADGTLVNVFDVRSPETGISSWIATVKPSASGLVVKAPRRPGLPPTIDSWANRFENGDVLGVVANGVWASVALTALQIVLETGVSITEALCAIQSMPLITESSFVTAGPFGLREIASSATWDGTIVGFPQVHALGDIPIGMNAPGGTILLRLLFALKIGGGNVITFVLTVGVNDFPAMSFVTPNDMLTDDASLCLDVALTLAAGNVFQLTYGVIFGRNAQIGGGPITNDLAATVPYDPTTPNAMTLTLDDTDSMNLAGFTAHAIRV